MSARSQDQQDVVLAAVRRAWAHQPHMRLGQLLVNATARTVFYIEDDDLMAALDNYDPLGPGPRIDTDAQRDTADRIAADYPETVRITPGMGPREDRMVIACPDGRTVVLDRDGNVIADSWEDDPTGA